MEQNERGVLANEMVSTPSSRQNLSIIRLPEQLANQTECA